VRLLVAPCVKLEAPLVPFNVPRPTDVRLSSALGNWAGGPAPDHPEGHDDLVRTLRIYAP
jgi:hypothetical protein